MQKLEKDCYASMNDDFNTPILIAHLFDGVKIINSIKDGKESLNNTDLELLKSIFNVFVTEILGIISDKKSDENDLTSELMELILKFRTTFQKEERF